MNTVNIIGRLTRESELRYSPSGTAVLRNSVAVNRKFKRDETDFINITAFGKTAELIANHLNKGEQIGIEGHIQTGSYERDGRKVFTFDVIVDSVTFIGGKGNSQGQQNNGSQGQQKPNAPVNDDPFANSGQLDINSDDFPF